MTTSPRDESTPLHARGHRLARRALRVSAVLFVLAASQTAFADMESDARSAYDVGAAAYDKGDLATAAAAFARADAIAPSDVALELAIKCALRVGDAPLAMDLVGRADGRRATGSLGAMANSARDAFTKTASHLTIVCPETMRCEGSVDGTKVDTGRRIWLTAGEHSVDLASDGAVERLPVHLEAGSGVDVRPTRVLRVIPSAPAVAATPFESRADGSGDAPMTATSGDPPPLHDGKLAPGWFWGATALTATLAVGSIASAADTSRRHSAYAQSPSDELAREGRAAQGRTNALVVATGVSAIGTAALGLFAIRWSSSNAEKREIRASARGSLVTLEGSF